MRRYVVILLLQFLLWSCFEKDKSVQPYPGEITTIDHDVSYYQSYFDLETNRVMKFILVSDWDLAFACRPESWQIRTNSGNDLFICKSNLSQVTDLFVVNGNEEWKYDQPDGNPDSLAVGVWCDTNSFPYPSHNEIFVLARKVDPAYVPVAKFQLISADSTSYLFICNKPDETEIHQVRINKTDSVNFTYFSFAGNSQLDLEPKRSGYDLIFMPYYDLVYGIVEYPLPYLVRGVILNNSKVEAMLETSGSYDEITYYTLDQSKFTRSQNIIGWEWKDVSIDFSAGTAVYTIYPDRVYIIKSFEGNYFKLRFLSYYLNGIYGFPGFEFKQLLPAD